MSDGYCFISYSNADGLVFATKLATELESGHPFIHVWFDKNEMSSSGSDWDEQISSAIGNCKCLLFVMSEDSTSKGSNCKEEWTWALKCKKPVICLVIDDKAEEQFRLNNRQKIYFNSNFNAGIAQLKKALDRLDSPQGTLDELNYRLADAKRDLHRATEEDKSRIHTEIVDLTAEIKANEVIKRDPEKAKKQTRKNINAGLERDREPIKPTSGNMPSIFINPRPGSIPDYFEGRSDETKEIADFLNNDYQRIMTINGRAGSGKTVLVCRLLQTIENKEFPNEIKEVKTGGIVYLSEIGNYKINVANIFSGLLQLIETEKSIKIEEIYKEAKISVDEKIRSLLEALPKELTILLMDNFEDLIDTETETVIDQELHSALVAILKAEFPHRLKILITTRMLPRQLNMIEPTRQYIKHLEEGLPSPFAENVLRKMDKDGQAGLRDAPNELLRKVREATLGYPRALETIYGILRIDRYSNVEELLIDGLPETVVEKFVGEAFNRLDSTSQKIMQSLAVYNRPISSAAVDFALQFHIPGINSAPILEKLVSMHFVRRESKRYFLHPADRDYALSRIPLGETEKKIGQGARARTWSQHSLTLRAADYFAEVRKPRSEWRKLDDISPQLAEFDLRISAKDYNTATKILREIDYDYLLIWGHTLLVIDLHMQLIGKADDPNLINWTPWALGLAYEHIGENEQALLYSEQALALVREQKDKESESSLLVNLGNIYSNDQIHEAIKYYQQALNIATDINYPHAKGSALSNLGHCYLRLNDPLKAVSFLERGLSIQLKSRDEKNVAVTLTNLGRSFSRLEDFIKAEEHFKKAIQISDRILYLLIQRSARNELAGVYLIQNKLEMAYLQNETAFQYFLSETDFDIYTALLKGIITLRQKNFVLAHQTLSSVITRIDEISADIPNDYEGLNQKGIALCGLILVDDSKLENLDRKIIEILEIFSQARKIAPYAGTIIDHLRLFDELAKFDTDNILKDVRKAVKGKE